MTQPHKTEAEIQAMREGGAILGRILRDLRSYVAPKMTGIEVDEWVSKQKKQHGIFGIQRPRTFFCQNRRGGEHLVPPRYQRMAGAAQCRRATIAPGAA